MIIKDEEVCFEMVMVYVFVLTFMVSFVGKWMVDVNLNCAMVVLFFIRLNAKKNYICIIL